MSSKKKNNNKQVTDNEELFETDNIEETIEEKKVEEVPKEELVYQDKKDSNVSFTDKTIRQKGEKKTLYIVRRDFDDVRSEVGSYTSLDDAIRECNKNVEYRVFTEQGRIVHYSILVHKPTNYSKVIYDGMRIELFEKNVFLTTTSNKFKKVSGVFYIVGHYPKTDRYKISYKKNDTNYIGCITADDLK